MSKWLLYLPQIQLKFPPIVASKITAYTSITTLYVPNTSVIINFYRIFLYFFSIFLLLYFLPLKEVLDILSSSLFLHIPAHSSLHKLIPTAISRPGGYAVYNLPSNMPKSPKKPQTAASQIFVTSP